MKFENKYIDSKLPKPLTKEELYNCFEKFKSGDKHAREKIINHNIRLVINEVLIKFSENSYDKEEMISIGLIGLIKSVDTFDTSKNYEFSTYATKCIDNEIFKFIKKENDYILDISLSEPIKKGKNSEEKPLEDFLEDINVNIVSDIENKIIYNEIKRLIYELPKRDREVLLMYFGFFDGIFYKQCEIAKYLNISNANVSIIIQKNLKKIYRNLNKNNIIECLDNNNNNYFECKSNKINSLEKNGRKLKSIYEYFNGYTKEQIDEVISNLNEYEKKQLKERYGNDLENPIFNHLTKAQGINFYGNLIPKMKRILLKNNLKKVEKNKKLKTIYEYFKDFSKNQIDYALTRIKKEELEILKLRFGEDLISPNLNLLDNKQQSRFYTSIVPRMKYYMEFIKSMNSEIDNNQDKMVLNNQEIANKQNEVDVIEKDDYIKLLEILKTLNFEQMMQIKNIKEAVIVFLRFGYVNNKYFSIASIADFLDIDKSEVIGIIKKMLPLYKDNINQSIINNNNLTKK